MAAESSASQIRTVTDWENVLSEHTPSPVDEDLLFHLGSSVEYNSSTEFDAKWILAVTGGARTVPAVRDYAVQAHRDYIEKHTATVGSGVSRWPVCWIDFAGALTKKDLDHAVLAFFSRPRPRAVPFDAAAECLRDHGTHLLVLAGLDGTSGRWASAPRQALKAHLIYVSTTAPVTIVLSGTHLEHLFHGDDPCTLQFASRTTLLGTSKEVAAPR